MSDNKYIDPAHLPVVAETFTELISNADKNRLSFLKLLLTIYTPITSGLFFISTTVDLNNKIEELLFLCVATSAAIIVLFSLVVIFTYFLSAEERAQKYINKIKETGKHYNGPLYGKKWHSWFIHNLTLMVVVALAINTISALGFIYSRIQINL